MADTVHTVKADFPVMTESYAAKVYAKLGERQKIDEEAYNVLKELLQNAQVISGQVVLIEQGTELVELIGEAKDIIARREKADNEFTTLVYDASKPENRVN